MRLTYDLSSQSAMKKLLLSSPAVHCIIFELNVDSGQNRNLFLLVMFSFYERRLFILIQYVDTMISSKSVDSVLLRI